MKKRRFESKNPPKVSGGFTSIVSSTEHILKSSPIRGAKALLKMNQKHGFDCPGCAWPDPDDRRSLTEFCENGVKALAEEAMQKNIGNEFFGRNSIAQLKKLTDFELGQLGRLTEPMIKNENSDFYVPIPWDSAFKLIAERLKKLNSPNEASFYTSGRTSNEAAFLYQLFVRMFGTNNLPDCSNMCHESSGVGLIETIGIGKGTVKLEDFAIADCILVVGQNPGTNHPRMLTELQKAARRGCQIVSINPLREVGLSRFIHPQDFFSWFGAGTQLASLHLSVKINGDVALFKGVQKAMLCIEKQTKSGIDFRFIKEKTFGFAEYEADLEKESWERICIESGISREQIEELAKLILKSKKVIACWAMGLTQHKNAVANVQEIVNLLLLGGHFGRPGAGVCPVRGHSNVQGDRTMGIYEKPSASFLDALESEFGFEAPRDPGFDTVQTIQAMLAKKVKIFVAMGGNFFSASPDTIKVSKALNNCDMTVQISTKLNRSHLETGKLALILPCLARSEVDLQETGEQLVTVENSMGIVHASRGRLRPNSNLLKSEVAIVSGMAEAYFKDDQIKNSLVKWKELFASYDRIRDHISRVVDGFSNFNERVRQPEAFYLPNLVRDEGKFLTSTKKAHFTVHPIVGSTLAKGRFLLMTIRSHDQFNTTIYGNQDRYRGIANGRKVVFMNPQDMEAASLVAGQIVNLKSHHLGQTREAKKFAIVPYEIPRGNLASYFPETNVLVFLESVAEKSNTPNYKSIEVSLHPAVLDID